MKTLRVFIKWNDRISHVFFQGKFITRKKPEYFDSFFNL